MSTPVRSRGPLTVSLGLTWLCLAAVSFAADYGRDPRPTLVLDSNRAGRSPAHRLSFDVASGELETYRAVVIYPRGFRFSGFAALGPVNTPVGAYEIDFDRDGTPELVVPIRSLTAGSAYADVLTDGAFSPDLEPALRWAGTDLQLRLPFGGDANAATRVVPFGARISLVLFAGVLVNPDAGGVYTVLGELTSVDPDTDGADDGRGEPPRSVKVAIDVRIEHVPFGVFRIQVAELKRHGNAGDRFMVHGHLGLGAGGDGADLTRETVTVTFGTFTQRISGRLFRRTGDGHQFTDKGPGIKHLKLGHDGRFQVDARDLILRDVEPGRPVVFILQIGDDRGQAGITFDSHGHCGPRPGAAWCAP